jgi:membrane protein DedA with SNARE-associated domain
MDEWLLLQQGYAVYVVLVLLLLGGSFGLPIPEDMPLLLLGVMIERHAADWRVGVSLAYVAILLSDAIIYGIGARFGPRLFKSKFLQKRLRAERLDSIHRHIDQHAFVMVFVARHLFYLRTATFLSCGAFGMRFAKFILADSIAALVSVPLLVTIGYLGAEHLPTVIGWIKTAKHASLWVGITLMILGIALWRTLAMRRASKTCARVNAADSVPVCHSPEQASDEELIP